MRQFFLWISFSLVCICLSAQSIGALKGLFLFNKEEKAKYTFNLQYKQYRFTGLCIMKRDGKTIAGSVINEFGIKAFDFLYNPSNKRIRVLNVIGVMDKWYIKRTLKKDWKYLLAYPDVGRRENKKRQIRVEDGQIVFENLKRDLVYTFNLLP